MVQVRNILRDDVYGLWHVERILIKKDGRRYVLIPNKERFKTKEGAEYYAHLRTRRFIEGDRGRNQNNTVQWRAALKYLCTAAFVSLMTTVAVQWWRDEPKNLDYSQKEGREDLIKQVDELSKRG